MLLLKLKELRLEFPFDQPALNPLSEQLGSCSQLIHLQLNLAEKFKNIVPGVFELPNLQYLSLPWYELNGEEFIGIYERTPSLREFSLNWKRMLFQLNESVLTRIINIRKRQALLNKSAVLRLKLKLIEVGEILFRTLFFDPLATIDQSILEKIRKIRQQRIKFDDAVILPFLVMK